MALGKLLAHKKERAMTGTIARQLKQEKPFSSPEQEVFLGLRIAAARVVEPWAKFLKATARLTNNQYNVLRILRGSHPAMLACNDIAERMIDRDPDITRLIDRLEKRGLVKRSRSRRDRRVVEVGITNKGLEAVRELDAYARRMPKALLGHLGGERLRQLGRLLESVISSLGKFP
jgi:DNA-binding MarR family transcriptional regulator